MPIPERHSGSFPGADTVTREVIVDEAALQALAAASRAELSKPAVVTPTPEVDLKDVGVEKMRQMIREKLVLVKEKDSKKALLDHLTRGEKDALATIAMVAAGVGTVDVMQYEGMLPDWTLEDMVGNAEGMAIEETTARHKFLPKFFAGFFAWELLGAIWNFYQFPAETLAASSLMLIVNGAARSHARNLGRGGELAKDFQDLPIDLQKVACESL